MIVSGGSAVSNIGNNNTISTNQGYISHAAPLSGKAKKTKGKGDPEEVTPLDTIALSQALSGIGAELKSGEKVQVKYNGEMLIEVSKKGESNWDKFAGTMGGAGKVALDSAQDIIEADPSFVFRKTIGIVKDTIIEKAPDLVKAGTELALYPTVRIGALGLDIYKAWKSLKDPNANLAEKIINVAHCVTDLGGVVASVAPLMGLAIPGLGAMAVIAHAADIAVFGVHSLGFLRDSAKKVRIWWERRQNQLQEQEQNNQNNQNNPTPEETVKPPETVVTNPSETRRKNR